MSSKVKCYKVNWKATYDLLCMLHTNFDHTMHRLLVIACPVLDITCSPNISKSGWYGYLFIGRAYSIPISHVKYITYHTQGGREGGREGDGHLILFQHIHQIHWLSFIVIVNNPRHNHRISKSWLLLWLSHWEKYIIWFLSRNIYLYQVHIILHNTTNTANKGKWVCKLILQRECHRFYIAHSPIIISCIS